jgi:integrase
MASITKVANGYRAQVYVKGVRDSKVERTKREAEAWAAQRETELRNNAKKSPGERHTLGDAMRRYLEEVTPEKGGKRWEEVRINAFLGSKDLPINLPIGEVDSDVLGKWRDKRLKVVSAGTVLRDFTLLSAIFTAARREWIIISRSQIKQQLKSLGYSPIKPIRTISQSVAVQFLTALRTGARAGELCSLPPDLVFDDYMTVDGKTGKRDVPLTPKSKRLLKKMEGFDDHLVFGITSQTRDALFRRARDRAGMEGFTFHDSRHTAATWIAKRLKSTGVSAQQAVLDLCKIFGWSNINQALTYYNPKMSDIVKRL